ncbi:MAG: DUF2177 family protein [Azospirillaceae bacterium]|nr:DUF2177 family protein [Azospirillaceae bacterium]
MASLTRPLATNIAAYATSLVVFLGLDAVWLTLTADIYRGTLGDMVAGQARLVPAVLFYLLDVAGIVFFCIRPALAQASGRVRPALVKGALFGFFTYATYDLTNYATLRIWTAGITALDMAWGTALTAVAAGAGYLAARHIRGI